MVVKHSEAGYLSAGSTTTLAGMPMLCRQLKSRRVIPGILLHSLYGSPTHGFRKSYLNSTRLSVFWQISQNKSTVLSFSQAVSDVVVDYLWPPRRLSLTASETICDALRDHLWHGGRCSAERMTIHVSKPPPADSKPPPASSKPPPASPKTAPSSEKRA